MKTLWKCGVLSLVSVCALAGSDVRADEPGTQKTAFLWPLFGNCSTGNCRTVSSCPNGVCGPVAPSYCPPGAACNTYGTPASYGNYGGYNGGYVGGYNGGYNSGFNGAYGGYAPVNGGYRTPHVNSYPAYSVPGYGVGGYAPVGGGYAAPVVVPAGGYYPAQSGYRGPAVRPVYNQPRYGQPGGFAIDDPFYP